MTKICGQLTGVERLYASEVSLIEAGLVFTVRGALVQAALRCLRALRAGLRSCRRALLAPSRGGATVIWLYYAPWRVECKRCGVTVEQVPWARHARHFTWALEELVAYMARSSVNCTAISRLVGISWRRWQASLAVWSPSA